MGQTGLHNKLTAIVSETDFKLDERSTLDILDWLKEYAEKIPFGQEKEQFWSRFYFIQENTPQQLADIYQEANRANGTLPAHQAFLLAFLKLLETTKILFNTFPARHRDLYYRELLGLKPRDAQADRVAIGITLNSDRAEYLIPKGTLFDAGHDSAGNPLQYGSELNVLANQGELTDLCWYRKEGNGWKSAIPLNLADNIEFPENGIRLFSPTPDDVSVLSGYLITSPLFTMPAGERTIKVTLISEWQGDSNQITAQISSGDHWLFLSVEKENVNLKLSLSANDDPTSPPNALDNMTFDVPVLKLSTKQGPMLPQIKDIEINININDNRSVNYASDGGIEQINATSFPFGQSPLLGSGFNLVAPEWYNSENATLMITPQWVGLPTVNFSTWYEGYKTKPDNSAFKIQGYLVTPQKREILKGKILNKETINKAESQSLFNGGSGDNNKPQGRSLEFTLPTMNFPLADSLNPNDWPAFVRIELAGQDFMHTQYWKDPKDKNLPYIPQISALQIQFNVEVKSKQFTVYPLTPFGRGEATAEMPTLTHDAFYLGFTGVLPGQTLSLYWQLEGVKVLDLSWFYLDEHNTWSKLDKLVDDQTGSLFDRGIWRTLLPQDASNQAALMPTGRYWLKAEIVGKTDPQDYPRIKGLLYNATIATLANAETVEQEHFINGLAADSIKQPVATIAAINSVTQPWASWNGRSRETEQAFLKRIPVRLSHRNRVLSWGNMVTLLKDHFVSLFDVRYHSGSQLTTIPAPEKQQLIVIPDNRYKDNDDALRPTLNPARLAEMVLWISQLSSPWAVIEINNPTYIDVSVSYQVTFISDVNSDYGHYQLQQQLSRIYMPWAENPAIGVATGNRIDYYQLLATIQQSPLVERVTNLSLTIADQTKGAVGASIEAKDNEVLILVWTDKRLSSQGVDNE
ncbi:hypothetical protein [Photorhabdus hainanensis]|uniref:hypothetical protein n=1 Tax=Photorhabdus hainanensis TaxID=1004166 RepID=UPI001BD6B9A4|nr:hypothetical protein [Photorhabdus hainanensis]MBS9433050.1 hypothetical protein [Photorhabdus hainanensis]